MAQLHSFFGGPLDGQVRHVAIADNLIYGSGALFVLIYPKGLDVSNDDHITQFGFVAPAGTWGSGLRSYPRHTIVYRSTTVKEWVFMHPAGLLPQSPQAAMAARPEPAPAPEPAPGIVPTARPSPGVVPPPPPPMIWPPPRTSGPTMPPAPPALPPALPDDDPAEEVVALADLSPDPDRGTPPPPPLPPEEPRKSPRRKGLW